MFANWRYCKTFLRKAFWIYNLEQCIDSMGLGEEYGIIKQTNKQMNTDKHTCSFAYFLEYALLFSDEECK